MSSSSDKEQTRQSSDHNSGCFDTVETNLIKFLLPKYSSEQRLQTRCELSFLQVKQFSNREQSEHLTWTEKKVESSESGLGLGLGCDSSDSFGTLEGFDSKDGDAIGDVTEDEGDPKSFGLVG